MSDKEISDLLRGMRDEPVPMDSVRRVRAMVAERTQPRVRAWWWMPAVAAALCTLVVTLWLNHRPAERPRTVALEQKQHAALPMISEPKRQPQPALQAVSRPKPKPVRPVRKDDDILIRIETPDPDVVILLVGD
jgi:hypothetical protein